MVKTFHKTYYNNPLINRVSVLLIISSSTAMNADQLQTQYVQLLIMQITVRTWVANWTSKSIFGVYLMVTQMKEKQREMPKPEGGMHKQQTGCLNASIQVKHDACMNTRK